MISDRGEVRTKRGEYFASIFLLLYCFSVESLDGTSHITTWSGAVFLSEKICAANAGSGAGHSVLSFYLW